MRARTMAKDGDKDDGRKGGARGKERRRRTVCVRVHECVSDSIQASWTEKERDGEPGERERETRIAL